jgi:hypothetical protein
MSVSAENKAIARHAHTAFGGSLRVHACRHDTIDLTVDILHCADRPCAGVTSYSTIGLSDYPMFKDGDEFPTRLEIAGACATDKELFFSILGSAAFCIMRTGKLCYPGAVFPNYVRLYYPSAPVPHLYFTAPFLWEDDLVTLDCGTKKVSWLLAIPISDAEYGFLKEHGDDALEDLFEVRQIDIFNLSRSSVVYR